MAPEQQVEARSYRVLPRAGAYLYHRANDVSSLKKENSVYLFGPGHMNSPGYLILPSHPP